MPTEKSVTLQPGPSNGNDAYVISLSTEPSWADGTNNSHPQGFRELSLVTWTNSGGVSITRSFLSFDLSQIPSDAELISAKLSLFGLATSHVSPQGNLGDNSFLIQRVLENWNETTLSWNNQPGTTTVNQIEIGTVTIPFNANVTNVDVTLLLKDMLINKSITGGFALKLKNESIHKSLAFASSEHEDEQRRPKLEIVYKN